jgi:glutamate carboxypeptidase
MDNHILSRALAWLSQQQAPMEQLIAQLVEVSSHTPDREGNDRVAQLYVAALRRLCRDELSGGAVASPSGKLGAHVSMATAGEAAVLLIGHHDTVFPKATFNGFREDDTLLRGPGVLDMKGGLVVIAYALGALAEAGVLGRLPLRVVSISDEETGSLEGRQLVLEAARGADCALVFESGRVGDQIITRRKGIGGVAVTAHGRAAHAGNAHHEGVNAIWALARFIDAAQKMTDYARGVTVNVGKVSGGMGKNTVPDRAEAGIDFRFSRADDGEAVLAAMRVAAADAAASVPGARLDVVGSISRVPLERTDASARLASDYGGCARAAGLGSNEAPLIGGGSDANIVAGAGVPAIDGLGPRGEGFHTVDEYVERASLLPKVEALVRFLVARLPA